MRYNDILSILGYAGDHDHPVRIVTSEKSEVVGVPTSLDTHVTAHEVYLRPTGSDETEIAISLGAITSVELI
ncbi:MAG TPA: hypothetical protein VFO96_10760 [Gemmatimonadales bacterium]|jgi:hypothetical protein|nr:hypothetical protein [Gemmatimonadales bacterium]